MNRTDTARYDAAGEDSKGAPTEWHALTAETAASRLESAPEGLSASAAQDRLLHYGHNRLPEARRRSAWHRLLLQFHNVLIYALLGSALLALLLDHPVDAAVIAGVVVINALIGFIQEGRAEAAMAAIGKMLARNAEVRRDGRWQRIDAELLVPGDRVRIGDGNRIPADLRLLEVHGLRCEEAALTGESLPVGKQAEAVKVDAALADRRSMAWSGTLVAGGRAVGIVVATGAETEIGRISRMLGEVESLTTPLIRQIDRFGRQITLLLLAITTVTVIAGIALHDMPIAEAFVAGVALIVAAIPEGLPAIITITLAIGVRRMARRNAIVRRLPAVETLGSVTVICTDKTGTLTRNRLRAAQLLLDRDRYDCRQLVPRSIERDALIRAAVLCNDAESGSDHGDPLERALIDLAEQADADVVELRREQPRLSMIPFSSATKWMATVHRCGIMIKGAPDVLIERCDRVAGQSGDAPLDRAAWQQRVAELAGSGLRLLALADAPPDRSASEGTLPERLRLLGVVAFEDPLRDGVPAAVDACRAAGIRVKMITGDHPDTARAVARNLGLAGAEHALSGTELDGFVGEQLRAEAERSDVFARTTSEHKLRLVEALQAQGEVVAMTGDGANDAPALKRADIGVSMGIKGTEAAHEASEIVLTDDNFSTIVAGIEEGRGVYDNIRKALVFILPTNGGEALVILLAVLAGLTLPLTPVQVLWVNMATAVTLALALAFEPVEERVMQRPPRDPAIGLVTPAMMIRIVWVAMFLTAAVFWSFEQVLAESGSEALARSVALNLLVACEAFYLFNCRRSSAPSWTFSALRSNPAAWICVALLALMQAALTYWPPMQGLFGVAALSLDHWLLIVATAAGLFVLVELEKAWFMRPD
jgi:calcium-translocating P-type ATPase